MKFVSRMACLLSVLLLAVSAAAAEGEMIPEDSLNDDGVEEELIDQRELKYGDEGDDVLELQTKLTELHYYSGNLSGLYREGTRSAVKKFQKDFGLKTTGNADAETLALLYATLYRPLAVGDSGEDVTRLQNRLVELGYYNGKVSGKYKDGTEYGIKLFQEKNGLDVTGSADSDTLLVLYSGGALARDDSTAAPAETPVPDEDGYINYTKRLAHGSQGTLVKNVQTRLAELGYYTGPISGNYLAKTDSAMRAFQKQNGLKADAICGEETWNLLFNNEDVLGPEATPRPTPEPTPIPYYIVVDVNNQVTRVYGRDENGDFTKIARQMLCSTGTKANPSDLGEFTLNGRHAKWCYFPKFGSHARYWTRINPQIAFHSVIYNTVNTMDMNVSSYKHLGSRASHGCVRLTVADSKWIYDNIGEGTQVLITDTLPDDPELRAALKLAPINTGTMQPEPTPIPTAPPVYVAGELPPEPLTVLKKGTESPNVFWLQSALHELGYYNGYISGTYLAGTENAVKAFQKSNNLRSMSNASVEMQELLYAQLASLHATVPEEANTPEVPEAVISGTEPVETVVPAEVTELPQPETTPAPTAMP